MSRYDMDVDEEEQKSKTRVSNEDQKWHEAAHGSLLLSDMGVQTDWRVGQTS